MANTYNNVLWNDRKRFMGMPLSFTRYILTDKKFITSKGFLSLEEDELDLYKVTDKKLSLPLSQRIFGCGTIVLNVRDVDTPIKTIKNIKNPRKVLEQIDKLVNEQRDAYRVRGKDMIAANLNDDNCDCDNCDSNDDTQ